MPPESGLELLLIQTFASDAEIAEAMQVEYGTRLFRLAYAMLGDVDEAEDAVQQTLVRALYNLERFAPGSNFRAWLFTIDANICRGMLRKRQRHQSFARLL